MWRSSLMSSRRWWPMVENDGGMTNNNDGHDGRH